MFHIRTKVLLGFGLILALASGVVLLIFSLNDQYIRQERITVLSDKAEQVSYALQDYFLSVEESYRNLAQSYQQDVRNHTSTFPILAQNYLLGNPSTQQLTVLSLTGRQLYRLLPNGPITADKLTVELSSPAFTQAVNNYTGLSKVYFLDNHQAPLIDIYVTIPSATDPGQAAGVLKGQVSLDNLQQIFNRLNLGQNGFAYLVDGDGQVLSHPRLAQVSSGTALTELNSRPIIAQLKSRGYQSLTAQDHYYTNEQGTPVVAGSNLVSNLGWISVVEQPESEVFATLFYLRNLLLISLLIILIALVILALLLSNNLAAPIKLLIEGTRRIRAGDLSSRVSVSSRDELQELADSFNTMASQLSQHDLELRQSNTALAQERDRQSALLQSLTDGVVAIDRQYHISLFNQAAERITGLTANVVLGQLIEQALPFYRGDKAVGLSDYTRTDPEVIQRLHTDGLQLKMGERVLSLALAVAPIKDQDGSSGGWVISFRDITQEHEFEAMKLDFVSMAAHELRTPLTSLRGYLSILSADIRSRLSEKEQLFLDRANISANQLLALVENLLNVSRIERGALKVDLAPMSAETMIASGITNLTDTAKQKNISLTYTQPEQPLPLILADQFRLSEVLTNLMANAINYTQPNGWVKVAAKAEGQELIISVQDNGEGIPASALPRLFTKFYRVQSTLAMGSKGTGLGLFISKSIMDAHHGRIWAESVEGKGSTFSFAIPIAPAGQAPSILGKPAAATIKAPTTG